MEMRLEIGKLIKQEQQSIWMMVDLFEHELIFKI